MGRLGEAQLTRRIFGRCPFAAQITLDAPSTSAVMAHGMASKLQTSTFQACLDATMSFLLGLFCFFIGRHHTLIRACGELSKKYGRMFRVQHQSIQKRASRCKVGNHLSIRQRNLPFYGVLHPDAPPIIHGPALIWTLSQAILPGKATL